MAEPLKRKTQERTPSTITESVAQTGIPPIGGPPEKPDFGEALTEGAQAPPTMPPPPAAQPARPPAGAPDFVEQLKQEVGYAGEPPQAEEYEEYEEEPEYEEPAEEYPREDMQKIAKAVSDGVKQELEGKINSLQEEVLKLRKLDDQIQIIVETLEKIESKYEELEKKASLAGTEAESDIKEIKSTVNAINEIMSAGLPALIREVRERSPQQPRETEKAKSGKRYTY